VVALVLGQAALFFLELGGKPGQVGAFDRELDLGLPQVRL